MTNKEILKYLEEYHAISPVDNCDKHFDRCDVCYQMTDCLEADYLEQDWDQDPAFILGKMLNKLEVSQSRSFLMGERRMDICIHCLGLFYNGEE